MNKVVMITVEGWKRIKPWKIVRCSNHTCQSAPICSHARWHWERVNCYNAHPEERMHRGLRKYIVCPPCVEENKT